MTTGSETGRYRVWTADPFNRSRIDHLAEIAAGGDDPTRDRDYQELLPIVAAALGLTVKEASEHVLRIVRERAKR